MAPSKTVASGKAPEAGKPKEQFEGKLMKFQKTALGKTRSHERWFTSNDVAKLVETTRAQLRKQQGNSNVGWQEIVSKERKREEKTYAIYLVDNYRKSLDFELRCWQCNCIRHLSSACSRGELCFLCFSPNHNRADCPTKRKFSGAEKGNAIDVDNETRRPRKEEDCQRSGEVLQETKLILEQSCKYRRKKQSSANKEGSKCLGEKKIV